MWPLDLSIAALAGLVLYLIVTRLGFDDSRWQFNATTYLIGVPLCALALAFVLRGIASRYVQKSLQLGFLFSVALHLLLLMMATGVVIFSSYYPQSVMGVKPERSPVKRTVPEYLFKTAEKRESQPDWSKPTDAETSSPVVPREERRLPPVEQSAPQLEMPQPQQPVRRPDRQHLLRRDEPTDTKPQPSNSPAQLARRQSPSDPTMDQPLSKPVAPELPVKAEASVADSPVAPAQQSRAKSSTSVTPAIPTQDTLKILDSTEQPLAGLRQSTQAKPKIGDMGLGRPRPQARRRAFAEPAGAAPTSRSVAVARDVAEADRMISPIDTSSPERGKTRGVQMSATQALSAMVNPATKGDNADAPLERNVSAVAAGVPDVSAGNASRRSGRSSLSRGGSGIDPSGKPALDQIAGLSPDAVQNAQATSGDSPPMEIVDRIGGGEPSRRDSSEVAIELSSPSLSGPTLNMQIREGSMGFADIPNQNPGVMPSKDQPQIAALDLTAGKRKRREVGGPVTPFGTKIAAVESFSRRVMRTEGGRAPTPAGQVGPATEEAIERGLAYLDSIQNEDGSWSLQGHGSNVLLRGDSAATGLCLLAFQGAGYTHKQHQYADTVNNALRFLVENQRTNGDLYRKENELSDRNVAFYSHGIAALALSEAYGMTQDPDLKEPAQLALNYIAATQHRTRGGWRYTAQVSADTSVTGWMMMALKSGQLSGLEVPQQTYDGIERWLTVAQSPDRADRYRYNPYAPDTPSQRHGRKPTPTMTSVGMLMRMYAGWRRDTPAMQSAADYLLENAPEMGTRTAPKRDAYYWYYATQVMFHMGGNHWQEWNKSLNSVLLDSQLKDGIYAGSWDPVRPVPDRWSVHAGRLYVTTMNLLNLEVYYRHLPIYDDTAE
ncbi:hypothetical protein N9N28_05950 [Rubripirellula amarantea]|nr:hypothetical protein [Rubripirellula amarantea]